MPLMGATVTLADGSSGRVIAEYTEWLSEDGIRHGHRLRVEIRSATCGTCPHGGGPVLSYKSVDAGDVTLLA